MYAGTVMQDAIIKRSIAVAIGIILGGFDAIQTPMTTKSNARSANAKRTLTSQNPILAFMRDDDGGFIPCMSVK